MQAIGTRSPKDPSSLKCELCNKTFTRSWLLKNHQRIHTGEKPYQCSFCEKAFSDKSNLRQHLKIHTTTEKLFQCGICQRTFAQRRYLMKHATEIHRDVSVSLYESEKKIKFTEPTKSPVKKVSSQKMPPIAVPVLPEIINRSADHQYLTRQKSKTKTSPDSKDEQKDKKYSEQDLKDFIKSNQKTMEKNGYIFIKQNFESLDTEPTLTEISDIPVSTVTDDITLKTEPETGNQLLKVNGKMVYLQTDNKSTAVPIPLVTHQVPIVNQSVPVSNKPPAESNSQTSVANSLKGRKLVAKKDTGSRRLANILKTGGTKKATSHVSVSPAASISFPKQIIPMAAGSGSVPVLQRIGGTEPFTLVPVVQNNSNAFIIPVSMLQIPPQQQSQMILTPSNTNLTTVVTQSSNVSNNSVNESSSSNSVKVKEIPNIDQQVIEVQPLTVNIDEKGAASDIINSQSNVSTPIVSDAPWQGIVNINSEQELLEYINSQSTSGMESDQGMTILIQNVENGAVMSLDSQAILTGSSNITSVFQDQSTILSDVLPVSGNVTEIQVHTDISADDNVNDEIKIVDVSEAFDKQSEGMNVDLSIVKEETTDSNDAPSQVMLTEANREHLCDTDDHFGNDHDDKMLMKNDSEVFGDHAMYTANVKCEIDVKTGDIMETEDSPMIVVEECANANLENCSEYKVDSS
ncbi:C2H2-type zinc finger [Mactra antiquata]